MSEIPDGYCQCGCGEKTNIYRGKPRKWIYGHQARGKNNSRFGAKLSNGTKQKISEANQGRWAGEKNPMFGKTHTPEALAKMSEWQIERGFVATPRQGTLIPCRFCGKEFYVSQSQKDIKVYCSKDCKDKDYVERFGGENNPFFGKHHSEETKEILSASTARTRSRQMILPSGPERSMHEALAKVGIPFEAERLINDKFCVDIFIPSHNLIIYVDGCYWHACSIHCPNAKKPKSDNARVPYLSKCGYNVEIIWEHDIRASADKVIEELCQKYEIPIKNPL